MTAEAVVIKEGKHESRDEGMCVMEFVAYLANEPHSDHPKCACPILTSFMIKFNDTLKTDDARTQYLLPLAKRMVGTRLDTAGQNRRRDASRDIQRRYDEAVAPTSKVYDEAVATIGVQLVEELLAIV